MTRGFGRGIGTLLHHVALATLARGPKSASGLICTNRTSLRNSSTFLVFVPGQAGVPTKSLIVHGGGMIVVAALAKLQENESKSLNGPLNASVPGEERTKEKVQRQKRR